MKEKIIVKCICKVLEGFNCTGGPQGTTTIPDAVEELEKISLTQSKGRRVNEFSSLITQLIGEQKLKAEEENMADELDLDLNSDDSENEDEELAKIDKPQEQTAQVEVIDTDYEQN